MLCFCKLCQHNICKCVHTCKENLHGKSKTTKSNRRIFFKWTKTPPKSSVLQDKITTTAKQWLWFRSTSCNYFKHYLQSNDQFNFCGHVKSNSTGKQMQPVQKIQSDFYLAALSFKQGNRILMHNVGVNIHNETNPLCVLVSKVLMTVGRTTMAVHFSCCNMLPHPPQILALLVLASLCFHCYVITLATYRPPTGRQKVNVCHFSWVSLFRNEFTFRKHCHFRCDSLIFSPLIFTAHIGGDSRRFICGSFAGRPSR